LGSEQVTVFAPGTTANVGPGFDCLGMAFTGKGDRVTVRRVDGAGIRVISVSDARIPTDPARNTAAIAAASVLKRAGLSIGLELSIEKGLPLSGGMGGSAASAAAGAVAANVLCQAGLDKETLLEAAMDAEAAVAGGRHADNVAPSLLGGAVVIAGADPLMIAPVRVHAEIELVLVTPSYGVETQKARALLPRDVPRADAIAQAAHLATLVLGLERGDHALIGRAMVDHIAEPARAGLYPGYAAAKAAGLGAGATGVVVSGAGPTVIALTAAARAVAVAEAMQDAYRRAGFDCAAHRAKVDHSGARVIDG
jgi:homoserine kinase